MRPGRNEEATGFKACDLVMYFGDFNRHVGRHIDGFDGVHGGYGVGQRSLEG